MAEALCQVCGDAIREERVYCARCHAPHHRDCWDFNEGCSIFACGGKECWHVDPQASEPTSEVVYIDENKSPPELAVPRKIHQGNASNWFVFLSMMAVCVLRGLESDPSPPVRLARPARKPRPAVTDSVRRTLPQTTCRPSHMRLRLSNAITPETPYRAIAQTVRDLPELPRGELIYLTRRSPIRISTIPGFQIEATQYKGETETGRIVTLGLGDFEEVAKAQGEISQPEISAALRAQRQQVIPGSSVRSVILVEPASQSNALAPGTVVEVDRVDMGADGPMAFHGHCAAGDVTVPAESCRPVLAARLRASAN